MAKFVKFSDAELSASGPADQAVFVNPEHVRVVRVDYDLLFGGHVALPVTTARPARDRVPPSTHRAPIGDTSRHGRA
jgi:hypothetical protein